MCGRSRFPPVNITVNIRHIANAHIIIKLNKTTLANTMMVEVFRTNVKEHHDAKFLVQRIHTTFTGCAANFDLDDCDNILRVQWNKNQTLQPRHVIDLLADLGFQADILPDTIPASLAEFQLLRVESFLQ